MGLNDPQWGNKNSGGPPDLEELLRKLNEKVAAMMGGKGGNGGEGKPGGGGVAKGFGGGIGLIAAIAALIWLGSGFYIVDASQRGVVLRFGKKIEVTQSGPALAFAVPDRNSGNRQSEPGQNRGGRLSRQRQE